MAEIRSYLFVRHLRAETSAFVLRYQRGKLLQKGRAMGFWFRPMSTSIAEVPVDDQELTFLFHARTADFQDAAVQGVVVYRIADPEKLAERVDFSIDLRRGRWLKQPLESIAQLVTQLAQELAGTWVSEHELREVLSAGAPLLRTRIEQALSSNTSLRALGLDITAVRIAGIAPTPELERALEAPMRERFQQEADEAGFERRALAVQKERAIQENELQNQIELAKREEQFICQRGVNEQRRLSDEAASAQISARAKADSVRIVEAAQIEAEKARMEIYRAMPQEVLLGLAAQELAGKLHTIEHVRIEPDSLKQLFAGLGRGLPAEAKP
jgi:regulator of protease activity HflC (stomatin/prohibitin superfamily)